MNKEQDDMLALDRHHIWHPFTQMLTAPDPLAIVRAKDATLYAADGKTYLDCNSSWWVNIHGHGNEFIKEAIAEQFETLDHVVFAGATHPKAIELSCKVYKLLPKELSKFFFTDDGSTAVEVALKMVFQYWHNQEIPKKRILTLDGAYHGDTFGSMSVSQRGYFNKPFEHLFFEVDCLDFPTPEKEKEILSKANLLFQTGEFAAMIVEPLVQGSAGMRMYRPEFLEELTDLAKNYEVLVIFDEIMTGWGRTGKMFAHNYIQQIPDIICLSKGITGGVLPLGLTVATETIFDAFLSNDKGKSLLHGHSYTANPLACAAACASLGLMESPQFFDDIDRISELHNKFFSRNKENKALKAIRQCGTILALEIKTNGNGNYFADIRDKAYAFFLENGLLIRPLGPVIYLNPPYCITDEELAYTYAVIEEFLESIEE